MCMYRYGLYSHSVKHTRAWIALSFDKLFNFRYDNVEGFKKDFSKILNTQYWINYDDKNWNGLLFSLHWDGKTILNFLYLSQIMWYM